MFQFIVFFLKDFVVPGTINVVRYLAEQLFSIVAVGQLIGNRKTARKIQKIPNANSYVAIERYVDVRVTFQLSESGEVDNFCGHPKQQQVS